MVKLCCDLVGLSFEILGMGCEFGRARSWIVWSWDLNFWGWVSWVEVVWTGDNRLGICLFIKVIYIFRWTKLLFSSGYIVWLEFDSSKASHNKNTTNFQNKWGSDSPQIFTYNFTNPNKCSEKIKHAASFSWYVSSFPYCSVTWSWIFCYMV